MSDQTVNETELWTDAWRIAWVGAANPTAVASTLAKHLASRTREVGTRDAGRHPAIQAMAGHFAFLIGMEGYALGPSDESLRMVREHAVDLGLAV